MINPVTGAYGNFENSFLELARRRLPHRTVAFRQTYLHHVLSYLQRRLTIQGRQGILAIEATSP
jgi:hypothetical protein